ncbi:MAG: alpha/beta hydrolase [Bdellovibrionales bacterium]|nr:alpha/beta hydrolase [Bdellovibrionales bacterium]
MKTLHLIKELSGVATKEAFSHIRALHYYPFGHTNLNPNIAVEHPDFGINKHPVLLVHGVIHNRSAFFALKSEMQKWQWTNVFTINYSTWHGSLTGMIEDLAKHVQQIKKETGASQIDIVAHSLGGLVARYYMTTGKGRGAIRQLITLGTAHRGAHLSGLLRFFLGGSLHRDLKKNSYFIESLNEVSPPKNSRVVSIYTRRDKIVWPYTNCLLEEEGCSQYLNIEMDVAGHMSLLYDKSVFFKIHDLLLEDYQEVEKHKGHFQPGHWINQLEEDSL